MCVFFLTYFYRSYHTILYDIIYMYIYIYIVCAILTGKVTHEESHRGIHILLAVSCLRYVVTWEFAAAEVWEITPRGKLVSNLPAGAPSQKGWKFLLIVVDV